MRSYLATAKRFLWTQRLQLSPFDPMNQPSQLGIGFLVALARRPIVYRETRSGKFPAWNTMILGWKRTFWLGFRRWQLVLTRSSRRELTPSFDRSRATPSPLSLRDPKTQRARQSTGRLRKSAPVSVYGHPHASIGENGYDLGSITPTAHTILRSHRETMIRRRSHATNPYLS